MDFSDIAKLAVSQVKQYLFRREYSFPNQTVAEFTDAMIEVANETTTLLMDAARVAEQLRKDVESSNDYDEFDIDLPEEPVPVFVFNGQVSYMFVANVAMTAEIRINVRRDA